jgi:hypothetical protein
MIEGAKFDKQLFENRSLLGSKTQSAVDRQTVQSNLAESAQYNFLVIQELLNFG